MKQYTLNLEKSFELHEDVKDLGLIEYGFCYNNCINILFNKYISDFVAGKYKIGYCYVGGEKYYFQRHCVILTDKNEILDISIPFEYETIEEAIKNSNDVDYYIFKTLNCDEYRNSLKKKVQPDFKFLFKKEEKEVYSYIIENGYQIYPKEYDIYIKPLL